MYVKRSERTEYKHNTENNLHDVLIKCLKINTFFKFKTAK